MSAGRDPYPKVRDRLLRVGSLFLAASLLMVGLWALPLPRLFYDDFPFPGWRAMNLALGFLLAVAISLERRLVRVALGTWLFFAVPTLVSRTGQTHHFSAFHNATQLGSLGFQVLLPLLLLALIASRRNHERPAVRRTIGKGSPWIS